jgi:hypothetical protein
MSILTKSSKQTCILQVFHMVGQWSRYKNAVTSQCGHRLPCHTCVCDGSSYVMLCPNKLLSPEGLSYTIENEAELSYPVW